MPDPSAGARRWHCCTRTSRDASHGLIAPERLVVTPHARLVVVEHVLGSAIEQLQFGRERLWQEFRLAIPSSAGAVRFDHRSDVNGIGITALSLILGRPIAAEEFPLAIPQLLMQARERSPMGEERPLSNGVPQLAGPHAATRRPARVRLRAGSARRARGDAGQRPSHASAPVALETFLARYTPRWPVGPRPPRCRRCRSCRRLRRPLHAASRRRPSMAPWPWPPSQSRGAAAAIPSRKGQPTAVEEAPRQTPDPLTAGADARRADRGGRSASGTATAEPVVERPAAPSGDCRSWPWTTRSRRCGRPASRRPSI